MYDSLRQSFHNLLPKVDFCSLRVITERSELLTVRKNILEPPHYSEDTGFMVTVIDKGGIGYAATSDFSTTGLRHALEQALHWANFSRGQTVTDFSHLAFSDLQGNYHATIQQPWANVPLSDKIALLQQEAAQCHLHDNIVNWETSLWSVRVDKAYFTSHGGEIVQQHEYLFPGINVTANRGTETQTRSLGGHRAYGQQAGWELLQRIGFAGRGRELAEQALQLLDAPNCPTGDMDLLLMPDQMVLQIHESIGHPLELDRILGDERNYAGTSFVTLDMFGKYQYGSELLNVTFDPTHPNQLISYGFDDEGMVAQKTFIIEAGMLKTPLGGTVSQARAQLAGVANGRVSQWNRPPIDRMANLNIEPGNSSLSEMIGATERGIMMQTNISWSIDDSRNKFQFGCEWGQLIENGELTTVVKNPNYRGISATFWRNLKHVGNQETFEIFGVPNCGKGEPNQSVFVGHASPVCVFAGVNVFGGES
jgi:predicted Zn-dependent protease